VLAQVEVGSASSLRKLVPAETLENSAAQQYQQMLQQAKAQRALAPAGHPQLQRLHAIAKRLIPHAAPWNDRARQWRWEVNLIGSSQVNAFCMPGGKIAFYTGILDQLKLTDDEAAMIMGHEMAHALREHARERIAKTQGTNLALRLGSQLLAWAIWATSPPAWAGSSRCSSAARRKPICGLSGRTRGYQPSAAVSLGQRWATPPAASRGWPFVHPLRARTHP
jgi:Zn-dependent protease with chaperone function